MSDAPLRTSPSHAWGHRLVAKGNSSAEDLTGAGFGNSGGGAFDDGSDEEGDPNRGVGVSEAEVLELTQRWSELRDRDTFRLLALERAVHQASNRHCAIGC